AGNADLVAQRPPQTLAQGQRAILDRMMLVNMQITLATELERKTAVLGELLEHMIEKADAGADVNGHGLIQRRANLDVRFLGLSLHACLSRRQLSHDFGPGLGRLAVSANEQAADAEIARELHVRLPITDHGAGIQTDTLIPHIILDQADLRLA